MRQGAEEQKWSFGVGPDGPFGPLGQMTDLYAPVSVSHWIQATSRRTGPWTCRLSAAEANPEGANSLAGS